MYQIVKILIVIKHLVIEICHYKEVLSLIFHIKHFLINLCLDVLSLDQFMLQRARASTMKTNFINAVGNFIVAGKLTQVSKYLN